MLNVPRRRHRKVAHLTTVDLSLRYLLAAQLDGARERGDEVIGISAAGPHVEWLEDRGIRHVALGSSTRGWGLRADLRATAELWRVLRRERPDVLHTHNPKPGIYGRIVGRLAGVPCVVNTVHGLYATEDDPPAKRGIVYGLEAVASRCSHAELVQNPEDLELLRRWRISPPRRTELLGNGVDLGRFRPPTTAERRAARSLIGVPDDTVVVGFVGRLVAEKGLPELLEAHRLSGGAYRLVVVGPDDPEKADALDRDLIEEAAAAGVHFLGHRDDVDELYRAFDVLCLPSHREGFPRSAMEAAATGLPLVLTDIRGCRQVVDTDRNGALVPVGDPAALSEALVRLAKDPLLRLEWGGESRRKAEEDFDERRVVDRVLASYERAAVERGRLHDRAQRCFDVVAAGVGLVVLSPVIAATAVAVRRRLGSPVLFEQTRPGRHGRPFRIRKFRTMSDERDEHGELLPDEVRLGRFGTVMRATSLDELPELVNVLRGEMSIVGPRPLLMDYLELYSDEQARRHDVRPGITGLAQVNGRNTQTWDERFADDTWYVDHRSLRLDLSIIATTVLQVLRREDVAEEGHVTRAPFEGNEVAG
ncbi:MAG: sugar transferase [Actinomycetota bacterium]